MQEKPSIDEVLAYAEPIIQKFISQHAIDLPYEQKDEIKQSARLRILQAYQNLDADAGWRAFAYIHARGAVLDYLKFGKGFQEQGWSLRKEEENGSRNQLKIFMRMDLRQTDSSEDAFNIDQALGMNGVYSEQDTEKEIDAIEINWDLLSRMAAKDQELHVFAKYIRGIGLEQMAPVFALKRARIGQLIQSFVERFDDPERADEPWFKQTCFALGICKLLGMPQVDQSDVLGFKVGWNYEPVNLDSLEPHYSIVEANSQTSWDV